MKYGIRKEEKNYELKASWKTSMENEIDSLKNQIAVLNGQLLLYSNRLSRLERVNTLKEVQSRAKISAIQYHKNAKRHEFSPKQFGSFNQQTQRVDNHHHHYQSLHPDDGSSEKKSTNSKHSWFAVFGLNTPSEANTTPKIGANIKSGEENPGTTRHTNSKQEDMLAQVLLKLGEMDSKMTDMRGHMTSVDYQLSEISSSLSVMDSRLSAVDMFITMERFNQKWQGLEPRLNSLDVAEKLPVVECAVEVNSNCSDTKFGVKSPDKNCLNSLNVAEKLPVGEYAVKVNSDCSETKFGVKPPDKNCPNNLDVAEKLPVGEYAVKVNSDYMEKKFGVKSPNKTCPLYWANSLASAEKILKINEKTTSSATKMPAVSNKVGESTDEFQVCETMTSNLNGQSFKKQLNGSPESFYSFGTDDIKQVNAKDEKCANNEVNDNGSQQRNDQIQNELSDRNKAVNGNDEIDYTDKSKDNNSSPDTREIDHSYNLTKENNKPVENTLAYQTKTHAGSSSTVTQQVSHSENLRENFIKGQTPLVQQPIVLSGINNDQSGQSTKDIKSKASGRVDSDNIPMLPSLQATNTVNDNVLQPEDGEDGFVVVNNSDVLEMTHADDDLATANREPMKIYHDITEYLEINMGKKKNEVYEFGFEVKDDSFLNFKDNMVINDSKSVKQSSPTPQNQIPTIPTSEISEAKQTNNNEATND